MPKKKHYWLLKILCSLLFLVFTPLSVLSVWGRLTFGKIYYQQIRLNCCPANFYYLSRSCQTGLVLFGLAVLLLWLGYSMLLFRGMPARLRARLQLSPSVRKLVHLLNFLYLTAVIYLSYVIICLDFCFPLFGSRRQPVPQCFLDQYVPSRDISFAFPDRKRNLIYIVSESLENSFAMPEFRGENLIPEMTALASANDVFPGCRSLWGTGCTVMSLYCSQLAMPSWREQMDNFWHAKLLWPGFFYEMDTLFEILERHGYQTCYMQGGKIGYVEKNEIFERVPGIRIRSLETMKNDPEYLALKDQCEWGINDRILWKHVRKETEDLSRGDKPFALEILTVDTHFPTPYMAPDEPRKFGDYRDVIRAQSRMIGEFIGWLKQQPFYEDTLVVISGDHTAWAHAPSDKQIREKAPGFQRTVYNCFINAAVKKKINPELGDKRCWAMFDMMPTILEAMGAAWNGHRLGVGTSLYSGEKTWLEKIGEDVYLREMEKIR